jgi:hypothetical protein
MCHFNGNFYDQNSEWNIEPCTSCTCKIGHIECKKIECAPLDCEVIQTFENECCSICTGQCVDKPTETIYENNQKWKMLDDDCIECECIDGRQKCVSESCPPIQCKNPVKKKGICCQECPINRSKRTSNYINKIYLLIYRKPFILFNSIIIFIIIIMNLIANISTDVTENNSGDQTYELTLNLIHINQSKTFGK